MTTNKRIETIRRRYFRKTIAHPEGSIVHHGDCAYYQIKICTCGLLHDLLFQTESLAIDAYPEVKKELAIHLDKIDRVFHHKGF